METIKVLEMNVDDRGCGGVFSLIKNVILNKPKDISIDIAGIERFENKDNVRLLNEKGTNIYYIGHDGNKLIKQLAIIKKSRSIIKKNGYDVVHIHSDVAYKLLFPGIAAKTMKVKKIILHAHASGIDGDRRRLKMLFHRLTRPLLRFIATDYATCSDKATEWLFPYIDKKNVIRINNGVNLEKFRFNPTKREIVRKKLNLSDKLIIGHVGRFDYVKNHDYLINVFSRIHEKNAESLLFLVGEGELMGDVKKKVEQLGLKKNVIFYGISNNVNELLQAFDVFLLPSISEGFPIVGVEAEAAGLPVVFSDTITREAKLIRDVEYLPIDELSIEKWAENAINLANRERKDTYQFLKNAQFDYKDTLAQFYKAYTQ